MTDVKIVIKTIDDTRGGIDKIAASVDKLATASDRAAIRMAAMDAKTAGLAQGVVRGKLSVDQAAESLAQFRNKLGQSQEGLEKTGKGAKDAGLKFTELKSKIDLITGGLKAAGDVFAKAFAAAKEGAAINQITESFDRMNASVFKTPDLLERMRDAARGTIGDVGLMEGVLKLTAGTSDDLARALSAAAPQLLEIAKASNKLNPSLGDTAFLYESISTGIKRSSPLILDNLGIVVKVGEANEKYAQAIGKTVTQLTAEDKTMALLNATMESGGKLIEQVGGNVDAQGDSFARMEVKVQDATNAFKQLLADGLLPVFAVLDGTYGNAVEATIQKTLEMAVTTEVLEKRLGTSVRSITGFWESAAAIVTGTQDEIYQGMLDMSTSLALVTDDSIGFNLAIMRTFGSLETFERLVGKTATEFYVYARAMAEAELADRKFFQAQQDVAASMEETIRLTAAQSRAIVNANLENHTYEVTAEQVAEAEKKRAEAHEEAAKAAEEAAEAMRELKAATGDYFVAALEAEAGAGFFNEALSDLGDQSAFVSDMTAEQKNDLELLTDAYDKAAEKLHGYELGIGTTGMEQDALSEKMSEQQAIMDELGPKIAQLNSVGGEYVSWTNEATINQGAVNSALFDAVDAAGGSAEQLAILGGALGLYSEEAVEAALMSATIQTAINDMAQQFVDGQITVGDMNTAIQDLITRLENPPPPLVLETNIAEAMEGLSEADAKLAEKLGVFTAESQGMATDAQTAFGDIAGAATSNMPTFEGAVDTAMANAAKSADENMAAVQTAVGDNLSKALTTAEGYPPEFGAVGTNIGQTMAATLLAEGGALANAAAAIVEQALAAAEAAAGIESPSKEAAWQMTQIIAGYVNEARESGGRVADALSDVIQDAFDKVGDTMSTGRGFGRLSEFFADMLFPDNSEAMSAVEERIAGAFGGQLPDLEKDFDELLGYAQSTGQSDLVKDLKEYRRLQDERNEAEKKMLEIQKQQQQLAFLQSQLDLLQMIQDAGLNPAEVLAGIELGLGADIEDLLAASQAAMDAMIAQANGQLGWLQGTVGGGGGGMIGGPGGVLISGVGGGTLTPGIIGGGLPAGNIGRLPGDALNSHVSFRDIVINMPTPNTGNPYLFGREVANQVANRLGVRG